MKAPDLELDAEGSGRKARAEIAADLQDRCANLFSNRCMCDPDVADDTALMYAQSTAACQAARHAGHLVAPSFARHAGLTLLKHTQGTGSRRRRPRRQRGLRSEAAPPRSGWPAQQRT